MFFFDPTYIILVFVPTLIITGLAQMWVRSAYQKWGGVPNTRRVTGYDTAEILIRQGGLQRVGLNVTQGELTDNFDPSSGVVNLSQGVARQASVAAMAITAHEFGHVQQHQQHSPLMAIRTMLVPSAMWGPRIGFGLIFIGLILNFTGLAAIGLILFAGTTLFTVVTLPVELDASRRAMNLLHETGLIQTEQDAQGARAVLTAAAFTYVAAVATSLLTLLYYAMIIFGGNRRR